MDEMTLLLDARPEPVEPDLSQTRARLLDAINAERQPRRSRFAAAAIGLSLAAAVAAAVVLVPWDQVTGGKPTSAAADPRMVLAEAAAYARQQPFTVPRPDQFVYLAPSLWLSVDGTHDGGDGHGNVIPGCRNGFSKVFGANDPSRNGTLQPCQVDPAYLPDLPTTGDGMVTYLQRRAKNVNQLGGEIEDLLLFTWLSPQSKAALFEAAVHLPALTVVPDAEDFQGRHGIGVRWGDADSGYETLVFDRTTHAYVGCLSVGIHGERGTTEIAPSAIVDRVGQFPR